MKKEAKIQLALTATWAILAVPTILFWSESTLWIGLMSIYAIVISHYTAYLAAKEIK